MALMGEAEALNLQDFSALKLIRGQKFGPKTEQTSIEGSFRNVKLIPVGLFSALMQGRTETGGSRSCREDLNAGGTTTTQHDGLNQENKLQP